MILKELTYILSNLNNFHSLEVVDSVSETQLQVGENSDRIIKGLKGLSAKISYHSINHGNQRVLFNFKSR